jgi:hypothetical protein
MAYEHFLIPGTKIILHTDAELEQGRVELFKPILLNYGKRFPHLTYDGSYPVGEGRCFDKAMELAKARGLTYVEGFMVFNRAGYSLPIGHAWCLDKNGHVVDPTAWKHMGLAFLSYIGVPIKLEYSDWWKQLTGYYGCMDGYFDGKVVNTDAGIYADEPEKWLQT